MNTPHDDKAAMAGAIRAAETLIAYARFDGEGAKRLGMERDANPHIPGRLFNAWNEGWDSIPRWRRTDYRDPANDLGRSPAPRPCPDPNPRRIGYE